MTLSAPAATPMARFARPSEPVVAVRKLSKSFRIPLLRYHTLKERVLHPSKFNSFEVLRAVDDVTFEVSKGEFFGIVGRNGSGKSTLLKCLAGIYSVDEGAVVVNGRLSPFIELGVGFNPDLPARDNVIINGIMLGLTRREARDRFDEIIAFAELEEYLDLKLKNYSSGMLVRLAFSVAIRVDAEVLLIDEVLAVGDAAFQQKCFDEFNSLRRKGRTILFVTHDMSAVERFCDRAMLLERGRAIELGDTATVTRRYNEVNFARLVVPERADDARAGPAAIADAWFEDAQGKRIVACQSGQPVAVCMRVLIREPIENPQFSVVLRNESRHAILAASSERTSGQTGRFDAGDVVVVRVRFENWLAPDRYALTAVTTREGMGAEILDHRPDAATLLVHGTYASGALTELPYDLEIVRG
jgi:ABC-type polysaccharide/polyol phosphate transport system ATPase subunit